MNTQTINNLIMKKVLTIFILSLLAFSNVTFAEEPQFIIEEPMMQFEPVNPGQIQFEPMQFEPIPFNPDDPYTDDPSININLDFELLEDGRPALRWNKYEGPNFLNYKILHDQDDPNLYYPEFGYIEYYEDRNKTGYVWDEPLPVGDNFLRVCVITTDNKRGCSNTITQFMPQAFYDNLERERAEMNREEINSDKPDQKPVLNNQKNNGFKLGVWIWNNLGIILTIIAVLLAATGFTFAAKRKQKSISKYMNQIDDTYSEYKMKAKRCEAELYRLKDIVDNELKSGKLEDSAYQLLLNRIEGYMIDIQKQIVNEKFGGLPASLKEEMFKMMDDGEITETEFETMQKLIKRSELSVREQDSLLAQIKDFKKQDEVMKGKGKSG